MSKPSWELAPVWATVLLAHEYDSSSYAFAKSYSNLAKVSRVGSDSTFALDPTSWVVVEERPEPDITAKPLLWDGENWLSVGDSFTLRSDTSNRKRQITYIGPGQVCYMLEGVEHTTTVEAIPKGISPYRDIYAKVEEVQDYVEALVGKRPSHRYVAVMLRGEADGS